MTLAKSVLRQRRNVRVVVSSVMVLASAACFGGSSDASTTRWNTNANVVALNAAARRSRLPESLPGPCSRQGPCGNDTDYRPADGWGRAFVYSRDGTSYHLVSAGSDGVTGTDDDIDFSPSTRLSRARAVVGCWMRIMPLARQLDGADRIILDTLTLTNGEFQLKVEPDRRSRSWTPWTRDSLVLDFGSVAYTEIRARIVGDSLIGIAHSGREFGLHARTRFVAVRCG
jgi:hypothetical protein